MELSRQNIIIWFRLFLACDPWIGDLAYCNTKPLN